LNIELSFRPETIPAEVGDTASVQCWLKTDAATLIRGVIVPVVWNGDHLRLVHRAGKPYIVKGEGLRWWHTGLTWPPSPRNTDTADGDAELEFVSSIPLPYTPKDGGEVHLFTLQFEVLTATESNVRIPVDGAFLFGGGIGDKWPPTNTLGTTIVSDGETASYHPLCDTSRLLLNVLGNVNEALNDQQKRVVMLAAEQIEEVCGGG
jgi:hypothetical protein